MTRRQKLLLFAPLGILGILLFMLIGGEIVRLLWNWLLPPLFGFPEVTFWQALGLLILSRILFGGFGSRGSSRSNFRRRMEERMSEKMADKWERMTPEERERFQRGMRGRWHFGPPADESKGE